MSLTKEELWKKWLEALRSGRWYQVKGALGVRKVSETSEVCHYCCLGVLCQVAHDNDFDTANGWTRVVDPDTDQITFNESSVDLPEEIQEFMNLNDTDPIIYLENAPELNQKLVERMVITLFTDAGGVRLSGLNDDCGFTFEEIADVIEKYLLPAANV